MKPRFLPYVLLIMVLLLWGVAAHAQLQINADIPFKFVAGTTEFSGGKCTFERPERSGGALTIQIRCGKTMSGVGALPIVEQGLTFKDQLKNEISFRHYGNRYFLSELWIKSIGAQINRSPKEDEAAKSGGEAKVVNLKVKGS